MAKELDSKTIKSGIWYFLSNVAVKAMSLITTPLFTRLLSKEQYGEYSNYLVWASIATIIVTMTMESSLISAKFDYHEKLNQYNLSILALTFCSTVLWVLIISLFPHFFVGITGICVSYLFYILINCFFTAVISYYQISERYQYRYIRSVAIGLFTAFISTILSVYLVIKMDDKLTGRILGDVIPSVIIGLILLVYFIIKGKKIIFSAWKYALKICIPYVPHLLSLLILSSIDRVMITRICGASDNALYSVAYTCGHVVAIIMVSMNNAFVPWLSDKLHEKEYFTIKKVSKYYITFFCLVIFPMMVMAPEILLIMGGDKYMEAKFVMVPVAIACVCQFLYTLLVNIEQYKKKTVGMAFASFFAALLNYELNYYLLPRYGYVSAAYTTLLSYFFLLILHMSLVRKMGMQVAYSYCYFILVLLIMGVAGIWVNYTYEHNEIRYISIISFVIFVLFVLIWNKIKIKELVTLVKIKRN